MQQCLRATASVYDGALRHAAGQKLDGLALQLGVSRGRQWPWSLGLTQEPDWRLRHRALGVVGLALDRELSRHQAFSWRLWRLGLRAQGARRLGDRVTIGGSGGRADWRRVWHGWYWRVG